MKKLKKIKIKNKKEEKSPDNEKVIEEKNEEHKSLMIMQNGSETIRPNISQINTSRYFYKSQRKNVINFDFPGFFFKKFNLTSYKKSCDDSRAKSKSPERIYKLNHKKGNGIPEDLLERLKYINNIINDEKFQKYYNSRPKIEKSKFEEIENYIIDYYKSHNELKGLLMVYYFICNDIKYYDKETLEKIKESYKKVPDSENIFLDYNYFSEDYNPKPSELYSKGIAISPSHITNIFEYFLKRLEIKYKHIDGYCKLLETKKENTKRKLFDKKLKFKTLDNFYLKSRSQSYKSLELLTNLTQTFSNHSWHSVYIKGEWYFIDAFFGSGGVLKEPPTISTDPRVKNQKIFNIFYFMTPPQYLIYTHRPKIDYLQLLDKTLTFSQFISKKFIDYGDFYMGVFLNNVKLISHKYPYIEIKKGENLEIKIFQNKHVFEGELLSVNLLNKAGDVKISYDDEEKLYCIEPIFQGEGEFILRISSRPIYSSDIQFSRLFDYRIKVSTQRNYKYFDKYKLIKKEDNKMKEKNSDLSLLLPRLNSSHFLEQPKIIQDYSRILPSKINKIICYDNQDFHLIEPKTKILRKGIKFKFKLKIKNASNVNLLDGNKWTQLKRVGEDIFEGFKEIETDNVSICCLRNKNVFTEVIKFMIYKDRSILSKSVFQEKSKRHILKSIANSNKSKKNLNKKIN